jgi:hypothetical protein
LYCRQSPTSPAFVHPMFNLNLLGILSVKSSVEFRGYGDLLSSILLMSRIDRLGLEAARRIRIYFNEV